MPTPRIKRPYIDFNNASAATSPMAPLVGAPDPATAASMRSLAVGPMAPPPAQAGMNLAPAPGGQVGVPPFALTVEDYLGLAGLNHPMDGPVGPGGPAIDVPPVVAGTGPDVIGGSGLYQNMVTPDRVMPMSGREMIARLGVTDPAQLRAEMERARVARGKNIRSTAQGTAIGTLLSMLFPQADAGAFYRNTTPALYGVNALVQSDAAKRTAEDAAHQKALEEWYKVGIEGEQLGQKDREMNARAIEAANKENTDRLKPIHTYNYQGKDGRMHAHTIFSGGQDIQYRLQPYEPDASSARLSMDQGNKIRDDIMGIMRQIDALKQQANAHDIARQKAVNAGDLKTADAEERARQGMQDQIVYWQRLLAESRSGAKDSGQRKNVGGPITTKDSQGHDVAVPEKRGGGYGTTKGRGK